MNKNIKYILQTLSVVGLILAAILFKRQFISSPDGQSKPLSKPDTTVTIVQYIDSSTHTVNHVTEILYKNGKVKTPSKFDTLAVLRAYFTSRIAQNTYRDSNISITVYDTLLANAIAGRSLDYKVLKPSSVVTKTVRVPSKGLYIGAVISPSAQVYPTVCYNFKNWMVGASMVRSGSKTIPLFNLQYKIR